MLSTFVHASLFLLHPRCTVQPGSMIEICEWSVGDQRGGLRHGGGRCCRDPWTRGSRVGSWVPVKRRRRRSGVLEGERNSELVHHKPTTHAPSEKNNNHNAYQTLNREFNTSSFHLASYHQSCTNHCIRFEMQLNNQQPTANQ